MIPLSDMDRPGQRFPLFNVAFVVANILVYAYQSLLDTQPLRGGTGDACVQMMAQLSGALTAGDQFVCTYAVIPSEILRGQDLFTLVTAMFLHGSLLHVGSNMLYLWIFGDNIERSIGTLLYPVFYLLAGIVAFAVQTLIVGPSAIPNIGASGAVAGVLGAYIVLFPGRQVRTLLILGIFITITRVSALLLLGFWFVTQFLSGFSALGGKMAESGGVAYWAHIGGFIFGVVVGLALRAMNRGERQGYA
ncbi:MAG: rhomboid family intramembrane serine protease [Anaerolineae bacterium]|nr:rhomboid family intramembrane serine protease [Anaerolineae bacterium]